MLIADQLSRSLNEKDQIETEVIRGNINFINFQNVNMLDHIAASEERISEI